MPRRHLPALALLLALAACRAEEVKIGAIASAPPAYVAAVDAAVPTASVPTDEPDQWLLAHLDVETTGLVAFNSQFDAGFLDALMRRDGHTWRELFHYFVLDIPSMAWSLGYRDLTGAALAKRLNLPDEPRVAEDHTGITGAMLNVRIYRALQQSRDLRGMQASRAAKR
ncbi:MAG: hypothetical protein C0497_10975 [Gemmatimonas sp.]|nr:hypothetical protein [Gemmatimonas sp.]